MLGRLRMSIDECIDTYLLLSDRIFQKKRHRVTIKGNIQGRFDSEELAQVIEEVVVKTGLQGDALLKDVTENACKVYDGLALTQVTLLNCLDSCARLAKKRAKQYVLRATSHHVAPATSSTASKYGRHVVQRPRHHHFSILSPLGGTEKSLLMEPRERTIQCGKYGIRPS